MVLGDNRGVGWQKREGVRYFKGYISYVTVVLDPNNIMLTQILASIFVLKILILLFTSEPLQVHLEW